MVQVKVNIDDISALIKTMQNIAYNKDSIARGVATALRAEVAHRIHIEGKDAEGDQIGLYSDGYMAVRTGKFKSNGVYKRGKNKGKPRPEGVFTKGKNKGKARPKYNRTDDRKVVISLRGGQGGLESDFGIVESDEGYGLGFLHEENYLHSQYVEKTYKKTIYALTPEEERLAQETAEEEVKKLIDALP